MKRLSAHGWYGEPVRPQRGGQHFFAALLPRLVGLDSFAPLDPDGQLLEPYDLTRITSKAGSDSTGLADRGQVTPED
jgi:hypothetical protein